MYEARAHITEILSKTYSRKTDEEIEEAAFATRKEMAAWIQEKYRMLFELERNRFYHFKGSNPWSLYSAEYDKVVKLEITYREGPDKPWKRARPKDILTLPLDYISNEHFCYYDWKDRRETLRDKSYKPIQEAKAEWEWLTSEEYLMHIGHPSYRVEYEPLEIIDD